MTKKELHEKAIAYLNGERDRISESLKDGDYYPLDTYCARLSGAAGLAVFIGVITMRERADYTRFIREVWNAVVSAPVEDTAVQEGGDTAD